MARNPKKARAKGKRAVAAEPAEEVYDDSQNDQFSEKAQYAAQEVFRPGVHDMDADETLDYDRTAYDCLHKWSLEWPCLSFEIMKDGLGGPRSAFPHTVYMIAGTQAAPRRPNHISLMKLSDLGQGEHGRKTEEELEAQMLDEDDDDDDDDVEDAGGEARFECRNVALPSACNRVRCMPQQPGIVAVWCDNGSVYTFDCSRQLSALVDGAKQTKAKAHAATVQVKAMQSHSHSREGFALGWSPQHTGTLASGDMRGRLHVWTPREGGKWAVSGAYGGHEDSVEDIEWSPTEATVLATACVDKCSWVTEHGVSPTSDNALGVAAQWRSVLASMQSIRIFDVRDRTKAQLTVPAHTSDVNVITWNSLTSYMLASGGDDGLMRVWDLRELSSHVASFAFHRRPITGIEWCPHESSMLATSSEDDTVAVWDLAVERDPEEEASMATGGAPLPQDTPPQLMFLHAGQQDAKEVHWHSQIPGLMGVTAVDAFNLFKPSNVFELPAT